MVYESGFTTRRTYSSRPVTTSYAVTVSFQKLFTALTRQILRSFLDIRIEVVWCSFHKICAIHLCIKNKSEIKVEIYMVFKYFYSEYNELCVYKLNTNVFEDFMKRVAFGIVLNHTANSSTLN